MTARLEVATVAPNTMDRLAEKSIVSEQTASLFWENVSFCAPIKVAVPVPADTSNPPQTTDRLRADTCAPQPATNPPETFNGRPVRPVVWNLTGSVRPGEFVGLLGPSGSGKTVLLNILSSRLAAPVGSLYQRNVYVNNRVPLTRELFGKMCTYVMQDDVLMETMTPYECLSFSASLRLGCSKEEKEKHVIETISLLKLQTCMNTLVKWMQDDTSGGRLEAYCRKEFRVGSAEGPRSGSRS